MDFVYIAFWGTVMGILLFVLLAWGFYKRHGKEIDRQAKPTDEKIDSAVGKGIDKGLNLVTKPFIVAKDKIKDMRDPEMDALKAKQREELENLRRGEPWEQTTWGKIADEWDK